jgi:hypothetical protein
MDQVDKERRIQLANLLKERKKKERSKQINKQLAKMLCLLYCCSILSFTHLELSPIYKKEMF